MSDPTIESAGESRVRFGSERPEGEAMAPLGPQASDKKAGYIQREAGAPQHGSDNGNVVQETGQAALISALGDNRIVELEGDLRGVERQVRTLTQELSDHDARIAALKAALTSIAGSVERFERSIETSLKETLGEVAAYKRRFVELQNAQGAAASAADSATERRSAVIDQANRAELERLNRALQRSQLEVASARSRELIAKRDCAAVQRAYEALVASASWKATQPIRIVTKALSPKLRKSIHTVLKAAYCLVTPLSTPQRFREYQTRRRASRRFTEEYDLVATSPYFDAEWYRTKYPDVAVDGQDPLSHYLTRGAAESRDPGPSFDTSAYVAANADVAASGVNPLVHYLRSGFLERRPLKPTKAARPR